MARGPRLDVEGGVYHVMARGVERRAIFRDDTDRQNFLRRLEAVAEEKGSGRICAARVSRKTRAPRRCGLAVKCSATSALRAEWRGPGAGGSCSGSWSRGERRSCRA
jgi:hypothetical protein